MTHCAETLGGVAETPSCCDIRAIATGTNPAREPMMEISTQKATKSLSARAVLLAILVSASASHGLAYSADNEKKSITSDGSAADTQAAIDFVAKRAEAGWVLTVGKAGGSYTWNQQVRVSVPQRFTMQGASAVARPTITCTYGGVGMIIAGAPSPNQTTIKDINFGPWSSAPCFMSFFGTGVNFRLTNLHFDAGRGGLYHLAYVSGPGATGGRGPFGLVDHCTFSSTQGGPFSGFYIRQNADSPDQNWANNLPITWGDQNAVVFEDNTLTCSQLNGGLVDGDRAGKVVLRRNTLVNAGVGWHGFDSTADAPGIKTSFLQGEIYDNVFINNTPASFAFAIQVRGGTALVYHNKANYTGSGGNILSGLKMILHCANPQWQAEGCRNCAGNFLSAQLKYPDDYPRCQQPGFPQPLRIWGNSGNIFYGWGDNDNTGFMQNGRDFFLSNDDSAAPAGYRPLVYPHPLAQDGSGIDRPSAPTNLKVSPRPSTPPSS